VQSGATQALARYACDLDYRRIPGEIISRTKACALDTFAVTLFGSTKPWSRSVVRHVEGLRSRGPSTIFGTRVRTQPASASLANGTMAHAFELDNVRQPGAGVHPGATAFLPALAVAESVKSSGKDLLTAFVAACEVMFRIGVAAGNSLERRGFHAPGLTGTFGAAVAAGRLIGLDRKQMAHALGIAGSYSGGLLEFSRSADGAMIKRIHLGKAAEGGVVAALLAKQGLEGPSSILEGRFGFCRAFSDAPDLSRLTDNLGKKFETFNICIKRYACHINAHAPIEALLSLRDQHRFEPEEIKEIVVGGIEKLVTHHAIDKPADLMTAQYSLPFCLALSLYFDPRNPDAFTEARLRDPKIAAMAPLVRLKLDREIEEKWDRAARVTVRLKSGRSFSALTVHFKGSPQNFLSAPELHDKVKRLTGNLMSAVKREQLITLIDRLEKLDNVSKLTSLVRQK
jgi:2-methylcitrate dehydratase PrpD